MLTAYLFLLMALLSFASMGIFHKLADRFNNNPLRVTILCMVTALVVNTILIAKDHGGAFPSFPLRVMWLAVPFGLCASAGFWFFQYGLRYGRIATSWLFINLSAAVSTVLSIVVYHEHVGWKKTTAMFMILAALFLLWWDRKKDEGKKPNLGVEPVSEIPVAEEA